MSEKETLFWSSRTRSLSASSPTPTEITVCLFVFFDSDPFFWALPCPWLSISFSILLQLSTLRQWLWPAWLNCWTSCSRQVLWQPSQLAVAWFLPSRLFWRASSLSACALVSAIEKDLLWSLFKLALAPAAASAADFFDHSSTGCLRNTGPFCQSESSWRSSGLALLVNVNVFNV